MMGATAFLAGKWLVSFHIYLFFPVEMKGQEGFNPEH